MDGSSISIWGETPNTGRAAVAHQLVTGVEAHLIGMTELLTNITCEVILQSVSI